MSNSQQRQRVISLLTRARDLIQNSGWCTDTFQKKVNGTTHYCALGALDKAFNGRTNTTTFIEAEDLLREAMGGSIVRFNDEVAGRANGDRRYVIRAFNRAINLATR